MGKILKICSLCNAKRKEVKETLYGALICKDCHALLSLYGVKIEKEDIDKMAEASRDYWGDYFKKRLKQVEEEYKGRELISPTMERLNKKIGSEALSIF